MPYKSVRRKKPSKIQADLPASLVVYDLLEENGRSTITTATAAQAAVGKINPSFLLSEALTVRDWDEVERLRQNARTRRAEGVMIKRPIAHTS